LCLLGINCGQQGFEVFRQKDLVEAYEAVMAYTEQQLREGWCEQPWPQGLVPIYDGHGCAMVSYLDCNSPEGRVLLWDPGSGPNMVRDSLSLEQPSLFDYIEAAWPLR